MRIAPLRVCMCALLRGLCVRGVEHLNINNCHVGHLGPHSQLAPWAHSHHQHSCHGEREREEGDMGEEWETRERETHINTLGMAPKNAEMSKENYLHLSLSVITSTLLSVI